MVIQMRKQLLETVGSEGPGKSLSDRNQVNEMVKLPCHSFKMCELFK